MRTLGRSALLASVLSLLVTAPLWAGFLSTETFLPAVGRVPGQGGAQFYTTVWATNLTGSTVNFTFDFLKQGQANNSPASFSDTLTPGQTKVYENVVETKLGLQNSLGGARVTSTGEILVAERIYNQAPGDDVGKTEGLFFAGVPKAFSISLGQSASIQGINQGGAENFRYNFALVETGGGNPTVNVQLFDGNATLLGQKAYILQPYEQLQPGVADIFPGIATTNARITATVTGGSGSVLLAGAQLANESQDSSGFEMSFRDDLLGGGSGGLTAVTHDGTLVGNGTVGTPLGINPAAVVTSLDGLHGAVTLSAGSNVTLTPSGQTITIAASGGGGGGLTLPFSGSASVPAGAAFQVQNPATDGVALWGTGTGAGVFGMSQTGSGVVGVTANGAGPGVDGGSAHISAIGVQGLSSTIGVFGSTSAFSTPVGSAGVEGLGDVTSGVYGQSNSSYGVYGSTQASGPLAAGVYGQCSTSVQCEGVLGTGNAGLSGHGVATGVWAESTAANSVALYAVNDASSGYIARFQNGFTVDRVTIDTNGNIAAHGSITPNGIDYADRLPAARGLEPGDVVAIGPDGILQRSLRASDSAVAGVYSTKPGVEGRDESERRLTVPVALAGMIPVKATTENGPIRAGDLLVSSSSPGRAMKAPEFPAPGTVIGKAMEPLASGSGSIEMLVMLR